MEAHHPLNSTRVARPGLRNLAVAQVTDVNHRARFILTTLDAGGGAAASGPAGGLCLLVLETTTGLTGLRRSSCRMAVALRFLVMGFVVPNRVESIVRPVILTSPD